MRFGFTCLITVLFTTVFVFSCSDPRVAPTQVDGDVAVHPEGWISSSSSEFHGTRLASENYDLTQCRQCHGNQFGGGLVEVSCYKCHTYFPHNDKWVGNEEGSHGFLLRGLEYDYTVCRSCHGEDLQGGKVEVSCNKCHKEFPHAPNWIFPGDNFHGDYVKNNDPEKTSCKTCHGENLDGGTSKISCNKCHENYPHPEQWTVSSSEDFHGKFLRSKEFDLSICQLCHGDNFSGGSSNVSCYKCHTQYPHVPTWLGGTPESHGAVLKAAEYDFSTCESCHGSDLLGGSSGVSCKKCHTTFPHETGWVSDSPQSHAAILKSMDYNLESCTLCHGTDYAGGSSEVSCYKCHASFPHKTGWVGEGEATHGLFLNNLGYDFTSCRPCHGEDLKGGSTEISCSKCHADYPHAEGWINGDSGHGAQLRDKGYDMSTCKNCHGDDLQGGTSAISCNKCHADFPHKPGWKDGAGDESHTTFLRAKNYDNSSCKICHGDDLQGGTTGISCNKCHADYPHEPDWIGGGANAHSTILRDKGYDMSTCKNCHGEDLQGGTSGVSCNKCHADFPHAPGWKAGSGAESHTTFLSAANYDYTSCKVCHGEDLKGGTTGISCYQCHTSFPHPPEWIGTGAGSHRAFIQDNNYEFSGCTNCHGENYDLVKGELSCRSCHTQPDGPEACTTCHGVFNADPTILTNVAPPRGLDGEELNTDVAVGAHQIHLTRSGAVEAACQGCHNVPEIMASPGHIDADALAEVFITNPVALTPSFNGTVVPTPLYEPASSTCQNSYCHGNWKLSKSQSEKAWIYSDSTMEGSNATPNWSDPQTAECGSCHGLPPKGHNPYELANCVWCHYEVVDETGTIIDSSKHINGKINYTDFEYDMY